MKRICSFVAMATLLVGCAGLAAAQCAGNTSPGGYDLLSTFSGTQDTNVGNGIGSVSFTGMPVDTGLAGAADTVVCRITPLTTPFPSSGQETLNIQVVALLLQGTAMYNGQMSNVYAVINQTQDSNGNYAIPLSQLPQPDTLSASTGTMTVFQNGSFNTNSLNIQADIIVVPLNEPVTYTPRLTSFAMNGDTMSSSGSTWSTTAPSGYPNSTTFPSGGFYVSDPSGSGGAALRLIGSPIFRGSLYALGLVLMGIAIMRIRSNINNGRMTLRPAYLLVMAAIAWFLGWKSSKLAFPNIVHAGVVSQCLPHTISAWVNEGGGVYVIHKIVTAVCSSGGIPVRDSDPFDPL